LAGRGTDHEQTRHKGKSSSLLSSSYLRSGRGQNSEEKPGKRKEEPLSAECEIPPRLRENRRREREQEGAGREKRGGDGVLNPISIRFDISGKGGSGDLEGRMGEKGGKKGKASDSWKKTSFVFGLEKREELREGEKRGEGKAGPALLSIRSAFT